MLRAIFALSCAVLAFPHHVAHAQLPIPQPRPVAGARLPALSPDGKLLAFVYRGDIWVADAGGGRSTPLTRHLEMDSFPLFSPDGRWIAFSSLRTGNWDIFIVPAGGGAPRRLTWHSGSDIAHGWSPDGRSVLFSSRRDTGDVELLALDVASLRLRKLAQDYANIDYPSYSPDGTHVVYGHRGLFHWTRPRYHGSGAAQLGLLEVASGRRRNLTDNGRQHLWPRFMPDGRQVLTVTYGEVSPSSPHLGRDPVRLVDSPERTPNLWLFNLEGRGRQLTRFTGGSVRAPSVAKRTGDIAFEYGADLWMLRAGTSEPKTIVLFASDDDAQNQVRRETLTSGVTEAEPSPDGKTYAFGLRGDIWTIAMEKPKGVAGRPAEIARRLTDWEGDDSDFLWSADSKKLYYRSDREFVTRVFEVDIASGESRAIWSRPQDAGQLNLSPDGKVLAFWVGGPEGGLMAITLATGETRRLIAMPDRARNWQNGGDVSWSPDMRWLAVRVREVNGPWNVWILPADGGTAVNVTRLNAWHGMPRWTPDGRFLLFQSDRDGAGLYSVSLRAHDAPPGETDIRFEKPTAAVTVEIDFDGITRRIRRLSGQNPSADLTVSSQGLIYFVSDGDVWSVSYDGRETRRLTTGGGHGALRISADAKRAYFVRNGELHFMRLDANNAIEKVTFTADFERDTRAERRAAFTQFWSAYNRRFYDPNFHGRDWEAIRKRYEPMLESVETRNEFAALLMMMVGELEASHTEVGPAPGGVPSSSTAHMGFTLDHAHQGPGIRIGRVPPGAPGSFERTLLRPGEYVMAIDGRDVAPDENLYRLLNDRAGRSVEFTVSARPSREGARAVRYSLLSYGEWSALLYRNRTERLRNYVEQKSNGRISYVHIAGMGGGNQATLDRELYEYSLGKQAMIIDVRFNGGGNISDTLINWLERRRHGWYRGRDDEPEPAPGRAWERPTIVLMNEHSMSNAEMFPYAMRARGLARLVGMPTPGYVIWTGGLPLVDGTSGRMPGSGVFRLDGSPMENLGERPDVMVPMSAEDWLAERDPQLDKAIEMLLAGG